MAYSDFAWSLKLDLDRDGVYEQDETARLYRASIRRGRRSALEPMPPGSMTLTLRNTDGRYSPLKGILSGLDDYTPAQVSLTWGTGAVTNLDDNPSAETDPTGAVGVGSASVGISNDSWVGASSYVVAAANLDGSGIEKKKRDGTRFPVTAGLAYTWAPRLKCASAKNMKIQVLWYNSGGSLIQTNEATFTFGSGWARVVITATAPTGAITAALRVLTNGAQGTFNFWLDASFLYQGSTVQPYVDGDQPGCTWSGTAHQSTSTRAASPPFKLFTGFLAVASISEDLDDQTVTFACYDRQALLARSIIRLGNMLQRLPGLILQRIFDYVEKGEKITNPGLEWLKVTVANPKTNWSTVNGAALSAELINPAGAADTIMEGDWDGQVNPSGAQALSGVRYTATSDIATAGQYDFAIYARASSGTVAVRFRVLRDAVVVATTTVTLTTAYQRISLTGVDLTTLGTNRYIELVTDVASATIFHFDDLHAVLTKHAIGRDFNPGATTMPLVTAHYEPSDRVIASVLQSEPGFLFVKGDGTVAFRDKNSRPATAKPRLVLGDGDGLLPFERLDWEMDPAGRYDRVEVRSQGTPLLGSTQATVWELSPYRALSVGEKWRARYSQIVRRADLLLVGADFQGANANWGSGADIEVTVAGTPTQMLIWGYAYTISTEESVVVKEDPASGLLVPNTLQVDMPLLNTNSSEMSTEGQRLLDKYKNRVVRLDLLLHQQKDEIMSFQAGLELNDEIIVRAETRDFSPAIDKKFWVEGIEHQIDREGSWKTVLHLEEA